MLRAHPAILTIIIAAGTLVPAAASPAEASEARTELAGLVRDDMGKPLVGATVSIFGKSLEQGAVTAVTDDEGRFRVPDLPPGLYRLRAYLSGFLPSAFARVVIEEGMESVSSILMSLSRLDSIEATVEDAGEGRTFSELRWIVQHGDRNILKSQQAVAVADREGGGEPTYQEFEPQFALSGEFGVRAATYDAGLDEFPGAGAGLDARLAYARLFIPSGNDSHWLVSAQVLESALSSWAGRAEYVSGDLGGHRVTTGVSYGNYLYGDLEEFRPPEAALARSLAGNRSAEWFGSVYAADQFLLGSASIEAGLALQYFEYLDQASYASPRLEISYPVGSGESTVLRGSLDYRVLAPGGEDIGLLSRVASNDVYGPSPARSHLMAERTARIGVGLEHQLSSRTRLAFRVFQENADDQLVKTFLEDGLSSGAGHFVVGNRGDFETRGVGVALYQALGAVQGSIGYTFGGGSAQPPFVASPVAAVTGPEYEIHDVTTTLGTSIERTRTRLQAAYRIIRHPEFSSANSVGFGKGGDVVDSRFSFQVYQLLPFVGWNGTRWELMVAVRNLFYEDLENVSILDELAVVDAPRRVLGGVTVRF